MRVKKSIIMISALMTLFSVQAKEIAMSITSNGVLVVKGMIMNSTCTVQRTLDLLSPFEDLNSAIANSNGFINVKLPMEENSAFFRVRVDPPPILNLEGMVMIPAGTNSGIDPDVGAYSLTVDRFYMDSTEITKEEWDTVYNWAIANGYSFESPGAGKASNHPVQMVNWYDCVKWCNARSQMDGITPCYTVNGSVYKTGQVSPDCNFYANGYRLPTDVEWEYAARGGLSGKRFPWGDTITHSQANYYSDSYYSYDVSLTHNWHPSYDNGAFPYTSPVGSFTPNGYGLYDMSGNVWEWSNTVIGSSDREVLGGCWDYNPFYARCCVKGGDSPDVKDSRFGFRTIRH